MSTRRATPAADLIRFSELAELAEQWLTTRPLRPNSVRAYEAELQRLFEWIDLAGARNLKDIDLKLFLTWTRDQFVATSHGAIPRLGSLQQTKRIVAAFLRYAALMRNEPECIAWRVPTHHLEQLSARPEQPEDLISLGRLLASRDHPVLLDPCAGTVEDLSSRLLAAIAFWAAATCSELVAIKCGDVDAAGILTIGWGERKRRAQLPAAVHQATRCHIERQRRQFATTKSSPLFLSAAGGEMSAAALRRRLRALTPEEALRASPRSLRRLFAHLAGSHSIAPGASAYRQGRKQSRQRALSRDLDSTELRTLHQAVSGLATHA